MRQRWIFGITATSALALMSVAIWIQTNRFAFTSPAPATEGAVPPVATSLERALPASAAEPESHVIVLPPVEIRGLRRTAAHGATPKPEAPREAIEPCSPWREIGPMHVDDGRPSGVRHVRELC